MRFVVSGFVNNQSYIKRAFCNYPLYKLIYVYRDGHVSLQEYMSFMISRETENVSSRDEIEKAFLALTAEGKPYVTKQELYAVSCCDFFYSKRDIKENLLEYSYVASPQIAWF